MTFTNLHNLLNSNLLHMRNCKLSKNNKLIINNYNKIIELYNNRITNLNLKIRICKKVKLLDLILIIYFKNHNALKNNYRKLIIKIKIS